MTITGPITLAVPVYDGVADVVRCIGSILDHTPATVAGHDVTVVVIDDAAPDPAMAAALDELIAAGRGTASLAETLPDDRAEDPVATLVDLDNRRQLADAIAQLSERDRVVVTLYYFENLTLAEIGRVLGVTESRVCQLHTRAVLRLRSKVAETTED